MGKAPSPINVMTTGMPVMLDEFAQLVAGTGRDDAATAIDDRTLGQFDGGRHLLDLLRRRLAAFRRGSPADSSAHPNRERSWSIWTSLGRSISTGPGRPVVAT